MYEGNIVFCYDTSSAGRLSAQWLCRWPANVLRRHNYMVDTMDIREVLKPSAIQKRVLDRADIILYERHVDEPWMGWFEQVAARKRFFLVLDDAYHLAESGTVAGRFWNKKRLDLLRDVTMLAERVIAPSKKLSGRYLHGWFKPNRPDLLDPAWCIYPLQSDAPVIMWGGTEGHVAGLKDHPCLHAINRLCEEKKAQFIAIPGSPDLLAMLREAVPSVKVNEFVPYGEWLKILSGATVAVCPVGRGYDEYRSWIKALEAAAVGVPWVGNSNVYHDCKGGIVVEEEWYDTLSLFVEDEAFRNEMGEWGRRWAWKQGLDDHLDEWEAVLA